MSLKFRYLRFLKSTAVLLWHNKEGRTWSYVPKFSPIGFTGPCNKYTVNLYITTKFIWAFKSFIDIRGHIDFLYYRGKQILLTWWNKKPYIPAIGECFEVATHWEYKGKKHTDIHKYRVTHYERTLPPDAKPGKDAPIKNQIAYDILSAMGKTRSPREWCLREQADKIHGSGVAGIIIEPGKVKVIGSVKRVWKKEHLEDSIRSANSWAGQRIWA